MLNIMLTGVGGQGTVLAAKILAQAFEARGAHVRTAETIGMSQRGGSVISHVRMADAGSRVHSPLIPAGQAHVVIAFEPAEGLRVLPYLAPDGTLLSASSAIQPVTAALAGSDYSTASAVAAVRKHVPDAVIVDDRALLAAAGGPRVLNVVLLAAAQREGLLGISADELKAAVAACVKPRFVEMNLAAIDTVLA